MQTFLTTNNFIENATILDSSRLNKQLLEGRQILSALAGHSKGWKNHPATLMWRGHEAMLFKYLSSIALECKKRNIKYHNNWAVIEELMDQFDENCDAPIWMMYPIFNRITSTHRASLYKKNPEHYSHFKFHHSIVSENLSKFVCCDGCNYYWPTHVSK